MIIGLLLKYVYVCTLGLKSSNIEFSHESWLNWVQYRRYACTAYVPKCVIFIQVYRAVRATGALVVPHARICNLTDNTLGVRTGAL